MDFAEIMIIVGLIALIALDIAAIRWGADSHTVDDLRRDWW